MHADERMVQVEQVAPAGDDSYQVVLTVGDERHEVRATVTTSGPIDSVAFDPYPFDVEAGGDPRPVVAAVLAVHRGQIS